MPLAAFDRPLRPQDERNLATLSTFSTSPPDGVGASDAIVPIISASTPVF